MRAKLQEIKEQLRRHMHATIPEQGRWLKAVVTGFFACHAVPTNVKAISAFRRPEQRRNTRRPAAQEGFHARRPVADAVPFFAGGRRRIPKRA
jgi:hypothetical protein